MAKADCMASALASFLMVPTPVKVRLPTSNCVTKHTDVFLNDVVQHLDFVFPCIHARAGSGAAGRQTVSAAF